ncbi:Lysine-specific demethylase 3B [Tilletia horrida]|nr:Lysine-specific demethylase 3B [Tilletia horrida]KAK0546422.1 Lysine-specific demethylase 3B [Tilletia horrida]
MDADVEMVDAPASGEGSPLTPNSEQDQQATRPAQSDAEFEITQTRPADAQPVSSSSNPRSHSGPPITSPIVFHPVVPMSEPQVMFLDPSGRPAPADAKLVVQAHDCRLTDEITPDDWCKVCTYQQRRIADGNSVDTNFECSWKGSRALSIGLGRKHDARGSSKVSSSATSFHLHQPLDVHHNLVGSPPDNRILPSEGHKTGLVAAAATHALAQGVITMLKGEERLAGFSHRQPLERQGGADSALQCAQCQSFFLNSWQCLKCGTELCLNCFERLAQQQASTLVNADNVRACVEASAPSSASAGPAQTRKFSPHLAGNFMPLARLSVGTLKIDTALAHHSVDSLQTQSHIYTAQAAAQMDYEQAVAHPWGFAVRRRIEDGGTGRYHPEVLVVRAGSEIASKPRYELIEQALMVLQKQAFVIQQDVVPPLQDAELELLFSADQRVDVRCVPEDAPEGVPLTDEEWTWSKLVGELTGKTQTVRYLDIRDFPKDSDLRESSPPSTELFRRASCFPGVPALSLTDDGAYADGPIPSPHTKLCDLSSWFPQRLTQRDAKEKTYIASKCEDPEDESTTMLHVDEAGAMNTLLWTRTELMDTSQSRASPTPSGFLKLPARPAQASPKPASQSTLDAQPIGAQWLWWPPQARQHFEQAAEDCQARRQIQDWKGPVLFGQDFTANQAFIDRVVALGGEACRARVINQRVGETVVIPAGVPHQVRNLRTCFKIARDIMVPTHVQQMLQVQEERAQSTASDPTFGRDATMVRPSLYMAWRAVVNDTLFDFGHARLFPTWRMFLNEIAAIQIRQVASERRMVADNQALLERTRQLEQRDNSAAIIAKVKAWIRNRFLDEDHDAQPRDDRSVGF